MDILMKILTNDTKLLHRDKINWVVVSKDDSEIKKDGIALVGTVLVPLYPLKTDMIRGLVDAVELSEKEGHESLAIIIDPRKSEMGVVSV